MPGRAMIVGRSSRSQIVGGAPGDDYAHLTGAEPWRSATAPDGAPDAPGGPSAPPASSPLAPARPQLRRSTGHGPIRSPRIRTTTSATRTAFPSPTSAPGAPSVTEVHPTHPREFPIGFSSETLPDSIVPAGQTQGIEQKPQVLFRGERLAVPNSIVLNFDLEDIKVGKDSQLASPGSMPSECFSNLSVGVRMQLDTAEPGITITLLVTNDDPNNPHVFKSVLYGTVIE